MKSTRATYATRSTRSTYQILKDMKPPPQALRDAAYAEHCRAQLAKAKRLLCVRKLRRWLGLR